MKNPEINRLKRRMKANEERRKLKREAFNALKTRVTQARAKNLLPQFQRAVRAKRPPPPPATAKQVEALELKIENIKPAPQAPPPQPQINVPEPTVIVEPSKPDPVVHQRLGEMADANREISRAVDAMLQLLSDRGKELQIEVTGRDKKGHIKTFEVKQI